MTDMSLNNRNPKKELIKHFNSRELVGASAWYKSKSQGYLFFLSKNIYLCNQFY